MIPLYRKDGKIFNKILKLMRLTHFDDTQAGLKGFKGSNIKMFDGISIYRFGFDIELLIIAIKHGIVIKQMPVKYIYYDTESTVSILKDGFKIMRDALKIFINYRYHKNYDIKPIDNI